ncbi:toxin (plasmid) [Bacillus anthracis]|nr:toxin [Bacillus anthracis]
MGREQDVRVFMLSLYCSIPGDYWPFPYINKLNLLDLITKLEKILNVQLYPYSKHTLCVLFAITISRLLLGNTIDNVSGFILVNKNDDHYKTVACIISMSYKPHFGVRLSETELSFLAVAFFLSFGNSITTDSHKNGLSSYKQTFMPFAKEITKGFGVKVTVWSEL